MNTTLFRFAKSLALLGTLLIVHVGMPSAIAQSPTPVPSLLVPGFGSSPDAWSAFEQQLINEFGSQVSPRRAYLSTLQAFETQRGQLASYFLQSDTFAFAIAHSNGGLASRATDRLSNRQLRGIVTVGTPHIGHPIADHVPQTLSWLVTSANDVLIPPSVYFGDYDDAGAFFILLDIWWYTQALDGFKDLVSTYQSAQARVDVIPGSTFLSQPDTGLNSMANLQREATSMPGRRLGIVSHTYSQSQLCNLLFSDWAICYDALYLLHLTYFDQWLHWMNYSDPNDPLEFAKRAAAPLWLLGANKLYWVNAEWCAQIDSPPSGMGCDADGFVAGYRQVWPGGTLHDLYPGPSHFNEQTSTTVQNAIMDFLRANSSGFGLDATP